MKDMKCLGFRVQVVVRYHRHHITNIRCHPNTRIHIGFLLELFLFQLVLYHVDVTRVDGEISMEFILDSYLPDFLQINQCNGGSSNVAVAEPSIGNVFCGILDIGFGVGTLSLTLSAIPLSEHP